MKSFLNSRCVAAGLIECMLPPSVYTMYPIQHIAFTVPAWLCLLFIFIIYYLIYHLYSPRTSNSSVDTFTPDQTACFRYLADGALVPTMVCFTHESRPHDDILKCIIFLWSSLQACISLVFFISSPFTIHGWQLNM